MRNAEKHSTWKDVRCASLPAGALEGLADLRGRAEIRVALAGDRAWICWPVDGGLAPELVAQRMLSLPGVELFTEQAGLWYRLGEHLPVFDVPFRGGATGMPLERMIVPGKLSVLGPGRGAIDPVPVRLVRDLRESVRPATAIRCALAVLAVWIDRATSAELAPLQGVWRAVPEGEEGNSEAFIIGVAGTLPFLPECVRYWGNGLLLPLGFRAEPDLPEAAIRSAAGAGEGDLAVLDRDGLELIARASFAPLARASVRLARGASPEPCP